MWERVYVSHSICTRHTRHTDTQTHTEKFRTPSAIFNQEFDPSFHLGVLTWWAAVCTEEHMHT